jgi:hypothetical protein
MKKFIIPALVLTPLIASAQALGNVDTLLGGIGGLVNKAIPIVAGIFLLAFFWGLVKFIFAAGNEEAKSEGKKLMIWGVIAFFVMLSIYGLVRFVQIGTGTTQNQPIIPPTIPGI